MERSKIRVTARALENPGLRGIADCASLVVLLLGRLVQLPALAADDKTIIIDEGLAASAGVLPVTVAAEKTFKVADFRFGEYFVVSSKLGMAKGYSGGWIKPFEHDENEQKFSLVMKGAGPATASVTAVQRFESGPLKRYEVLPGVSVGVDPLSGAKDNLVASIKLDGEPAITWKLQLNVQRNVAGAAEKAKASSLSDGTREIEIRNVSSKASDGSEQAMTAILQSKLNATLN